MTKSNSWQVLSTLRLRTLSHVIYRWTKGDDSSLLPVTFTKYKTKKKHYSKPCNRPFRVVAALSSTVFLLLIASGISSVFAAELKLLSTAPFSISRTVTKRPGQLPHSRVTEGSHDIARVWLAGPTDRYHHGVLGDELEASRLEVETSGGMSLQLTLPENRVFEDLEPRLADLNGDIRDEIIVVESDTASGASLAVYGVADGRLEKIAATPFLGRPYRWLNPVGVGDFDGDGQPDIALVATPHIGGILRLYRFREEKLVLFAEYPGVSTHRIGTTELGLGRVVSAQPRDRLLVPNQTRSALLLLEFTPEGWHEITRSELSGVLGSSLAFLGKDRWGFRLENGKYFEINLSQ